MHNRAKGDMAEKAAILHLEHNGYDILSTNYTCKSGEIDIIARHGEFLIFVEVKMRRTNTYGLPREAVNLKKQDTIKKVAQFYINEKKLHSIDCRFDVIEVTGSRDMKITHIENAFW